MMAIHVIDDHRIVRGGLRVRRCWPQSSPLRLAAAT